MSTGSSNKRQKLNKPDKMDGQDKTSLLSWQ